MGVVDSIVGLCDLLCQVTLTPTYFTNNKKTLLVHVLTNAFGA
jgi:hypothetical protein